MQYKFEPSTIVLPPNMIRSKILANYYLFYLLGVKLSAVSNCPPPLVGVKLSYYA